MSFQIKNEYATQKIAFDLNCKNITFLFKNNIFYFLSCNKTENTEKNYELKITNYEFFVTLCRMYQMLS